MKLSTEQVQNIATLARLDLSEQELAMYSEQLSTILDYVEMLQEVDVTGVAETSQVTGLTNVFREDVVEQAEPDLKKGLIDSFPDKSGSLLRVQAVFDNSTEE